MKKLLLSILFTLVLSAGASANLSDVTYCNSIFYKKSDMTFFEKTKCKAEKISSKLNPMNYLEKRKECLKQKDRADTVAIGKRIYKICMENN